MTTFIPNQDGFLIIEKNSSQLTFNNVSLLRNQISPFHVDRSKLRFDASGTAIDSFFGLGYDPHVTYPLGIYGCTDEIPAYAGDSLANCGFLRVPFRRIPRILLHNRRELNALVGSITSADPNLHRLYRGQVREYYLRRSPDTLSILYNDPDALEPSLLPSSTRAGINLQDIGPEWSSLVQLFLRLWASNLDSRRLPIKDLKTIKQQVEQLTTSYSLWNFLISLAQHYGLPSAGLDVTDDIETALFFALYEFSTDPSNPHRSIVRRRSTSGEPSVIYFLVNTERFFIDFNDIRPLGFPSARPDAQHAYFLHTGWGLASNAIAKNLFMAVYLDPAGDWGKLPKVSKLFPGPGEDHFGLFLGENLNRGSSLFRKFTERFYWAHDA